MGKRGLPDFDTQTRACMAPEASADLSGKSQLHMLNEQIFNHKKEPMFKYSRMQRKIPSCLVCGSPGAHIDCTLFRVQVTTGWDFFLHSGDLVHSED